MDDARTDLNNATQRNASSCQCLLKLVTEGYTGADIKLVCREAAIAALDESFDIPEVAIRHFKSAINSVKPSDVKFYQDLAVQFRRFVDDASWGKQ